MSKVTISGNASGTGTLLIAAPNTNSDITLNLPTTIGTNNGSSVVTTDAAGNLGLGVAPSAWGYFKAFQVGVGSLVSPSLAANTVVYNNAYYNGSSELYITSNAASQYQQIDGAHIWKRAPSGTAGAAISFVQAMTLNANGALALQGGNTAASGVGITFPATQVPSSDANTLDDYEEGTWTPTFSTSAGGLGVTYVATTGTYTKVGKLVTVWGNIQLSSKSASGTGYLQLAGLPFIVEANGGPSEFGGSVGMSYFWPSNPCTHIQPTAGASTCILNYAVSNLNCTGSDLGGGSYFRFTVTYRASS